jgi:hypothetical protein
METYESRIKQSLVDKYFERRAIKEMLCLTIALGLSMTTFLIIQFV